MKCKGGWRVGHASQEIAMQLGMLGKERRIKFSALTPSPSPFRDPSQDEVSSEFSSTLIPYAKGMCFPSF